MKSMFDNYFGGKIDSRSVMQGKIRKMEVTGSVIAEAIRVVESRTPAEILSDRVQLAKEKKWQLVASRSSGAPFLGDAFELPNS
ncbi:hypothetical protein [Pseudomonas sp. TCU-HL1]|uniref:hypothetical protein n=1 Tax=Pseudomonas sp. TCU-HL1 TaxID=1856685 RepID=UPI00083D6E96|nr:hypothetical protein [Pseudomonas sp. TCU-HL1]AOE85605.1 hypothetical protein THL1_3057 [Pseudomonas sp. TCU-HL1]AOE85630.1 hypothetical protein THL1_3082 [Pseudomonas sp. TCU-HL1]AOE85642.1 hypothetical protein THL1_3094 [Pseudomonas sp. TCU-HL1]